jgi:hypothetical protein
MHAIGQRYGGPPSCRLLPSERGSVPRRAGCHKVRPRQPHFVTRLTPSPTRLPPTVAARYTEVYHRYIQRAGTMLAAGAKSGARQIPVKRTPPAAHALLACLLAAELRAVGLERGRRAGPALPAPLRSGREERPERDAAPTLPRRVLPRAASPRPARYEPACAARSCGERPAHVRVRLGGAEFSRAREARDLSDRSAGSRLWVPKTYATRRYS